MNEISSKFSQLILSSSILIPPAQAKDDMTICINNLKEAGKDLMSSIKPKKKNKDKNIKGKLKLRIKLKSNKFNLFSNCRDIADNINPKNIARPPILTLGK